MKKKTSEKYDFGRHEKRVRMTKDLTMKMIPEQPPWPKPIPLHKEIIIIGGNPGAVMAKKDLIIDVLEEESFEESIWKGWKYSV